ncbi:FAD-dependent oxidoreductase [Paraburkholderia kururiensis]
MTFDFAEHPALIVRAFRMPGDTPVVPAVIVGAGACGLTSAIRLREASIDCLLLERDAVPGGSTALSSGFIPAAETRLQRAFGIQDSKSLFAEDVMKKSHGQAAPHLVQAYMHGVTGAIDTIERLGVKFHILDGFLYPGHRARRMHTTPERTGAALMACLERTAVAQGADVLVESVVRELWLDENDRVLGVGYASPDGTMAYVACEVLILACNGFGGNAAMVRELLPAMADAVFGGHIGNDGSAIAWGKALDAQMADLGGYQGHGSWITPQGALMTWAVMMEGGVQINARGERFHNENLGYSEAATEVLAQPGAIAWNVFDEPVLTLARTFPDYVEAEKAGALRMAEDVLALAALIGCDVATLQGTLNGMAAGVTDSFGRTFKRSLQKPYYAVKVTGALFHTQGGLDIDAECRVLRKDGSPFPNLLAAGGAARGVSGNEVWGYLSGNGLLSAVGGGWVAGATAAAQIQG